MKGKARRRSQDSVSRFALVAMPLVFTMLASCAGPDKPPLVPDPESTGGLGLEGVTVDGGSPTDPSVNPATPSAPAPPPSNKGGMGGDQIH
jgi:hypothetical protein